MKRNTSDPLWIHTGLILAQLDGLQAGVTDWAKQHGRTVSPGTASHTFIIVCVCFIRASFPTLQIT